MSNDSPNSDISKLQQSFEFLNKDLYRIEYYNSKMELPFEGHAINEIINGGIFACNPEDAQQFLGVYIDRIISLRKRASTIVKRLSLNSNNDNDFQSFTQFRTKINFSGQDLKKMLKARLSYYHEELSRILSQINDNIDALGTNRFANAGFKLRLNLNNVEAALFFKALFETGIILQKEKDGSDITKDKLAHFINANFSSDTVDNISIHTLKRYLSANETFTKPIEKIFDGLLTHVTS